MTSLRALRPTRANLSNAESNSRVLSSVSVSGLLRRINTFVRSVFSSRRKLYVLVICLNKQTDSSRMLLTASMAKLIRAVLSSDALCWSGVVLFGVTDRRADDGLVVPTGLGAVDGGRPTGR
jgi:hypothetical protein